MHPTYCDTILWIFDPRPDLAALSSTQVGHIIFVIGVILRQGLGPAPHAEVCLLMVQVFLYKVSRSELVVAVPRLADQQSQLLGLMNNSGSVVPGVRATWSARLAQTRRIYLNIWLLLLES